MRAFRRKERVEGKTDDSIMKSVGLDTAAGRAMHRIMALAHFHERFVIATTRREQTANAPYIERGFAGYDEMAPSNRPKRRGFFHGQKMGVGS